MVRRPAQDAGIKTAVVNHTFRATGITSYLENGDDRDSDGRPRAPPFFAAKLFKLGRA
jgi:hypothetical protein